MYDGECWCLGGFKVLCYLWVVIFFEYVGIYVEVFFGIESRGIVRVDLNFC